MILLLQDFVPGGTKSCIVTSEDCHTVDKRDAQSVGSLRCGITAIDARYRYTLSPVISNWSFSAFFIISAQVVSPPL
jgi:hypothetical protein